MICNTCNKEIEDSSWKLQCGECYSKNIKRCLLCDKKKQNAYLFCYSCNKEKNKNVYLN